MTHNFLTSKFLKGVSSGYPLLLTATDKQISTQEFNVDFVKRILPRLDYPALKIAADSVGEGDNLPDTIGDTWQEDEPLMRAIHRVLVEVEINEGELKCPETGRIFAIKNGIPNMLANEDELESK